MQMPEVIINSFIDTAIIDSANNLSKLYTTSTITGIIHPLAGCWMNESRVCLL